MQRTKRITVSILVAVLGVTTLLATPVSSVSAQGTVPVTDEANIRVNLEILKYIKMLAEKEYYEDPTTDFETQSLLRDKYQRALEDIQGDSAGTGFQGYLNNTYIPSGEAEVRPYVETQPDKYFEDVSTSELNRFLEKYYGYDSKSGSSGSFGSIDSDYDSPFADSVRKTIKNGLYKPGVFDVWHYETDYTLDEVVANSGAAGTDEDFLAGDFSAGGWDAWFAMTQNPDNNPFHSYQKAENEIQQRISYARQIEQQKLEWSDGVHGDIAGDVTEGTGKTVTPGYLNKERLSRVVSFCDKRLNNFDEYDGTNSELLGEINTLCDNIETQMLGEGILDPSFSLDTFDITNFESAFEGYLDSLESQFKSELTSFVSSSISSFFGLSL